MLQRKIGLKVLEMGGNSVIGLESHIIFDKLSHPPYQFPLIFLCISHFLLFVLLSLSFSFLTVFPFPSLC